MIIEFIGSGSAFVYADENFQSNVLISKEVSHEVCIHQPSPGMIGDYARYEKVVETKRLLLDAGDTVKEALKMAGYDEKSIDAVYVSHLHGDHTDGLEWLAFKRYFGDFPFGKNNPDLYGNTEILEDLWKECLQGRIKSIQGQTSTLETYYKTHYIAPNGSFDFYGTKFELVQTVHVVDNRRIVPSYGLIFEDNGKRYFFSGDAQSNPNQMMHFYQKADVIFHDCEFDKYPQSVHAQFHELCELPDNVKSKIWLYHFTLEKVKKTFDELNEEVKAAGFAGLIARGQKFDTETHETYTTVDGFPKT